MAEMICPRCDGTEFNTVDTSVDEVVRNSDVCNGCSLYFDGWTNKWYLDAEQTRELIREASP